MNSPTKAQGFAVEILRRHPQISFAHAVSAAAYEGILDLSHAMFTDAQRRLGLECEQDGGVLTAMRPATETVPEPPPVAPEITAVSELMQRLEQLQTQVHQTEAFRAALVDMRRVVREALRAL